MADAEAHARWTSHARLRDAVRRRAPLASPPLDAPPSSVPLACGVPGVRVVLGGPSVPPHTVAFGVGRAGVAAAAAAPRAATPRAAIVFVDRALDGAWRMRDAGGDSLLDTLRAHQGPGASVLAPLSVRVRGSARSDCALASGGSRAVRRALALGRSAATLGAVRDAALGALPPEHAAALAASGGQLTRPALKRLRAALNAAPMPATKVRERMELLADVALATAALQPSVRRGSRRRSAALNTTLALHAADGAVAALGHIESLANAREDESAPFDWSQNELDDLLHAYASICGEEPPADALAGVFALRDDDAPDMSKLHKSLCEAANARKKSGLFALAGALIDERGQYVPFVEKLARALFVERKIDERDCKPAEGSEQTTSLLGFVQNKTHSAADFAEVTIMIVGGGTTAFEAASIHRAVADSPLAKNLTVQVLTELDVDSIREQAADAELAEDE